jgi:hypothetical protein
MAEKTLNNAENVGIQNGEKPVRDANGHFVKGNPGGRNGGRPKASNLPEYQNIIHDEITPEKWRNVVSKAYEDAIGEDAWARDKGRTFLAARLLPAKLEVEHSGNVEFPVQVIGVEGFNGWQKPESEA